MFHSDSENPEIRLTKNAWFTLTHFILNFLSLHFYRIGVNAFFTTEAVARRCSVKKHPCQSLFFNKVTGLRQPATLQKKKTLAQALSCEFCEIAKNTFFIEHLRWLLLSLPILDLL